MTRIPPRTLDLLRRQSAEARISAIREYLLQQGITHVALVEGDAYGTAESEGKQRLFKTPVADFMLGKGEIGEPMDVTDEYGATEEGVEREKVRLASAFVEAAVRRDRVQSSQHMRQLLEL